MAVLWKTRNGRSLGKKLRLSSNEKKGKGKEEEKKTRYTLHVTRYEIFVSRLSKA